MALFSVVVSFNNKKRAFAETLFYYPCIASESCQGISAPPRMHFLIFGQ